MYCCISIMKLKENFSQQVGSRMNKMCIELEITVLIDEIYF
jgi:hypothetical protein